MTFQNTEVKMSANYKATKLQSSPIFSGENYLLDKQCQGEMGVHEGQEGTFRKANTALTNNTDFAKNMKVSLY